MWISSHFSNFFGTIAGIFVLCKQDHITFHTSFRASNYITVQYKLQSAVHCALHCVVSTCPDPRGMPVTSSAHVAQQQYQNMK